MIGIKFANGVLAPTASQAGYAAFVNSVGNGLAYYPQSGTVRPTGVPNGFPFLDLLTGQLLVWISGAWKVIQTVPELFSPLSFGPNLIAWVDFNDASSLSLSGASITAATNKGTAVGAFAQGTGSAQPQRANSGSSTYYASFDNGDRLVWNGALSAFDFLANGSAFEVWAVTRDTVASSGDRILSSRSAGDTAAAFLLECNTTAAFRSRIMNSTGAAAYEATGGTVNTAVHVWRSRFTGSASGTLGVYADDYVTTVGTDATITGLFGTPTTALSIGADPDGSNALTGSVSQLVLVNRLLTSQEAALLRGYMGGFFVA
jgi:hypothetical protein